MCLSGCVEVGVKHDRIPNASFADFVPVIFKQAHPRNDGPFDASDGDEPELFSSIMDENLRLIKAQPKRRVRVIGSTDDSECVARECIYLSARRALVIEEWLIVRGVARSRFDPIMLLGENYPASENNGEDGRRRNRRAEIGFSSE